VTTSRLGLVQVYTGDGKGKTTASLGLAIRACGQGLRVCMLQFLKGGVIGGEQLFASRYRPFPLLQPNEGNFFSQSEDERNAAALKALALARNLVQSDEYDLVILDESVTAVYMQLISVCDLLDLLRSKRADLELVLTGRGAPPELVKEADLVTEMVAVKHPFQLGVRARRGIEY